MSFNSEDNLSKWGVLLNSVTERFARHKKGLKWHLVGSMRRKHHCI